MRFSVFVASTIALGMSAVSAAAVPVETPPITRYAQLRIFGKPSCSEQNMGEIGVYNTEINKCNVLSDPNDFIRSVKYEMATPGCKRKYFFEFLFFFFSIFPDLADAKRMLTHYCIIVNVYSDLKCHLDKHEDFPVGQCLSGGKQYRSYELVCK